MNELSWGVIGFLAGLLHAWGLAWFLEKRMTALFQRTTFNISEPGRRPKEGGPGEPGPAEDNIPVEGAPEFIPPRPKDPQPIFQVTDDKDEDEDDD